MKKYLLLIIICYAGCTENVSFIKGQLPDATCDNDIVYLVPFEGASAKTVDSTFIQGSRFQFKIKQNKHNQIFIIRVKPLLRLNLQDILIISEPGTIFVNLNNNSSSSGTPMNETLQQWKERKQNYSKTIYSLYKKMDDETTEVDKTLIQTEIDNLSKEYQSFIDSLILQNQENQAGKFISLIEKTE